LARTFVVDGQPQVFSDIQALELEPQMTTYIREHNLRSVIVVPLRVRGRTIGLMTVATDDAQRNFSRDEVKLAETIASDIAAAVENARLAEQDKRAAAAEERSRLARDLHDAVTQTIYSANLITEALPRLWERSPDEGLQNLTKLRQLVRGALAEMRSLLFELRPDSLERINLNTLLQQLADILTGRTRIPVEVELIGQTGLPVPIKTTFYRIAQEALNNVTKHARASKVFITLQQEPRQVILTIRDNGMGFDPAQVSAASMGLRIMRERVEKIGADLTIQSKPRRGTQIRVSWSPPLANNNSENEKWSLNDSIAANQSDVSG
jgi:signal transduction histidine kinase